MENKQLLENVRGKDVEPWSTAMTVWRCPSVALPPQTSRVLLTHLICMIRCVAPWAPMRRGLPCATARPWRG
jgi:hypothetical protein